MFTRYKRLAWLFPASEHNILSRNIGWLAINDRLLPKEHTLNTEITHTPDVNLKLVSTNIRSLYQVHDTRGTPKLHDKKYTLYTEVTHTPDLRLKIVTKNTHCLHQMHITREIHQFYTFLNSDFEKYTGYTRCILSIFGVYPPYTIYTKYTRLNLEYVSAGYAKLKILFWTLVSVCQITLVFFF